MFLVRIVVFTFYVNTIKRQEIFFAYRFNCILIIAFIINLSLEFGLKKIKNFIKRRIKYVNTFFSCNIGQRLH